MLPMQGLYGIDKPAIALALSGMTDASPGKPASAARSDQARAASRNGAIAMR